MSFSKNLVISDNVYLAKAFLEIIERRIDQYINISLGCHESTYSALARNISSDVPVNSYDLKNQGKKLGHIYDMVFSIHSKQIFPDDLINNARCINVHSILNTSKITSLGIKTTAFKAALKELKKYNLKNVN